MSLLSEQKSYDDPKYRSYASQVEKALKNFEYSAEWADLISALKKLNRVLQANTSYELLPKRITIGKRLSQCLHPALPGGVHIKALEVYDTIFKIIGKKRLEMDLHIYGSGIFSLLANASMQVRPVLLNVYDTHLLPLGEKLRASLDGMLLGLLPGLEEGSEHFDRINLLLDKISKGVGLLYFYSSLWRSVVSSPSGSIVRLAATQLVLRQFDKKKMTDDQLHLIGLDVDVMVHAMCEALQDENVLTQRATLDVLGYCFPLSSLPVSRSDAQQILSSAVNILLRRDMSLNRRLHSWLLGTDIAKSASSANSSYKSVVQYFELNSRDILTSAILDMIHKIIDAFKSSCCVITVLSISGIEAKLLRIIISLLDKAEIGPVILNDIFNGILRLIDVVSRKYKAVLSQSFRCKKCQSKTGAKEAGTRVQSEFIKLVNLFVNTFETDYIWNVLTESFSLACRGVKDVEFSDQKQSFTIPEVCGIIDTMLQTVSMETYIEIQTTHLPELLNVIFKALVDNCEIFSERELSTCLQLSIEILKHVQPAQRKNGLNLCKTSFQKYIAEFVPSEILRDRNSVTSFSEGLHRMAKPNLVVPTGYEIILKRAYAQKRKVHVRFKSHGELNSIMLQAFQDSCKLLVDICCFPTFDESDGVNGNETSLEGGDLPDWLVCLMACCCSEVGASSSLLANESDLDHFYAIRMTACTTVLELMAVTLNSSKCYKAEQERSVVSVVLPLPLPASTVDWIYNKTDFYERVCEILWAELDETLSIRDSCNKIWSVSHTIIMLHQLCPDETVERLILQDILSKDQASRVVAIKKFAKLWHYSREKNQNGKNEKNFSRCLFAVLDQLTVDRHALFPGTFLPTAFDDGQSLVATTVSVWLKQVLEEGDLGRILEPYMLISLEGRTHRKSLQNFLQHQGHPCEADQIAVFTEKYEENLNDASCRSCAELQQDITDDDASVWSRYQNLSMDSVLNFALCEVHQQIILERRSYEHLVGLLTLSDEVQTPARLKSSSSIYEEDVGTWVLGFVKMVIAQGMNIYKSQLENSGEHCFVRSETIEEMVSDDVVRAEEEMSESSTVSQATEAIELNQSFMMNENPLYNHVLIYQEKFDTECVLYGLQGILNIVSAHPSVFVYAACTTSLSSSENTYSNLVQELLVRHERSIEQGRCFYEATSPSLKGVMKNRMLIEVLISICLYYLRSAFFNTTSTREASWNHEIHTIAANLLKFIVKELTTLAQQDEASNEVRLKLPSSSKQFSAYIVLVLQRQQVQSAVLTCLLTTIFALKNHGKTLEDCRSVSNFSGAEVASNFDAEALHFSRSDHIVERYLGSDVLHITTMFSHFLCLIFELVTLEHYAFSKERKVSPSKVEEKTSPNIAFKRFPSFVKPKLKRSHLLFSHLLSASHQYDSDSLLASQKVFVSTILEIYRLESQLELHLECSIGLHSILPYLGTALSDTVVPILLQQCLNVENASKLILAKSATYIPPSYLDCTLKSIVSLTHYCLLTEPSSKTSEKGASDSLQSDTVSLVSAKTTQSLGGSSSIGAGLSTLFNVFNSSSSAKSSTVSNEAERSGGLFAAKIAILNNLARIVSCMCVLWKDVVLSETGSKLPTDVIKGVSYNILHLLGPLAIRYGEYLLVAFSLVWQDRESDSTSGDVKSSSSFSFFVKPNSGLEHIVDLMSAIKVLSTEMYFSLVKRIINNPPPTTSEHRGVTLQESLLKMLLYYMRRLKSAILMENWSGFLPVIQETLALGLVNNNTNLSNTTNPVSPNCYFLLMYLLSEFVKHSLPLSGRKEQRELQDIVTRCIDTCNTIAGSSLEQGTWIRRSVSVLPGPQAPEGMLRSHRKTESQSSIDLTESQMDSLNEMQLQVSSSDTLVAPIGQKTVVEANGIDESRPESAGERPSSLPQVSNLSLNPVNFRNSVKALTVMSEVVANLLDVVYSSEEKEKVVPILVSIIGNVTPYLRNHSKDNAPSFCACVSFLASISGFQYTRRAWRKDVIDLFLDGTFFHMPSECLEGWRTIIDNLMTHDKMTFKEVMSRTSLSKPGPSASTLSLFSNREQEHELRSLHIKRLAFVVFSSEVDQYQKQLPEIQDRLAESWRLNNIPGVQCRVFLCFRVLLLRMSSHSLTSLWPTIFTELVHAMLQLEQALQPSFSEENHKTKPKSKSSRVNSPASPGDRKTVMTCWLDMYLSACKLFDLILCLPVHYVPQFQLFKWGFIGDATLNSPKDYYTKKSIAKDSAEKAEDDEGQDPEFVPHCVRIKKLFGELFPARKDKVLTVIPEKPLLGITRLRGLDQLQLFFNTITSPRFFLKTQTSPLMTGHGAKKSESNELQKSLPLVERYLEKDFVRPML